MGVCIRTYKNIFKLTHNVVLNVVDQYFPEHISPSTDGHEMCALCSCTCKCNPELFSTTYLNTVVMKMCLLVLTCDWFQTNHVDKQSMCILYFN